MEHAFIGIYIYQNKHAENIKLYTSKCLLSSQFQNNLVNEKLEEVTSKWLQSV